MISCQTLVPDCSCQNVSGKQRDEDRVNIQNRSYTRNILISRLMPELSPSGPLPGLHGNSPRSVSVASPDW